MKNESQDILLKNISHYCNEIDGLYEIKQFIEKQISLLETENVIYNYSIALELIDYNSFLIASYLDLLTAYKGIINSETKWDNIFNSKSGYLSIYETINTYHSYQRKINLLIEQLHPEVLQEYIELNKNLKTFKKEYSYDSKLSQFRNRAAGHYAVNYSEYYEQIKSLESQNSLKAIGSFANLIKEIMHFVSIIIDKLVEKSENELIISKAEWENSQNE